MHVHSERNLAKPGYLDEFLVAVTQFSECLTISWQFDGSAEFTDLFGHRATGPNLSRTKKRSIHGEGGYPCTLEQPVVCS